jgi:hypothetical protein
MKENSKEYTRANVSVDQYETVMTIAVVSSPV